MEAHVQAARDLVQHIDRALATRRLYSPEAAPYRDAMNVLWERFREAAEEGDITLTLGPSELLCDGEVVLRRDRKEDAFHFPLYRDGLREFRLSSETPRRELEKLLDIFEAERRGLVDSTEDTVGYLWRCDLQSIAYSAIDGIGDAEGGEEDLRGLVGNDFDSLVAEVTARFQKPTSPSKGQSYAFVLDADVELPESDFHYDGETEHKPFEGQTTVLRLTSDEATRLRADAGEETEDQRLDRFVEILFAILTDPETTLPGRKLGTVIERILEGYWKAEDLPALEEMLGNLQSIMGSAPETEKRETAQRVLRNFLGTERLLEAIGRFEDGTLAPRMSHFLWTSAGDEGWRFLFRYWAKGSGESVRESLEEYLRRSLVDHPELLRNVFAEGRPEQIQAGLDLLGERAVLLYAEDVVSMMRHTDPGVRAKAVALAGHIGGNRVEKTLWQVLEMDPEPIVRQIALRRLRALLGKAAAPRLTALLGREGFPSRPMRERIRTVRILGEIGGKAAERYFEAWIPSKWLWQNRDLEAAELAIRGLLACGQSGLEKARALTATRSPAAKIARRLLGGEPDEDDVDTAALEALASGREEK